MIKLLNKTYLSKNKVIMITVFLLFLLVISLFSSDEMLSAKNNIDLFELAFNNRSDLIRGEADYNYNINALEDFLYQFDQKELETMAKSDYLNQLRTDINRESTVNDITLEQALEDVDFLFKVLKFGYAGYQIYGGDERFGQAREGIISDLKYNYSDGDKVLLDEFEDILYTGIDFIGDTHFSLAGRQMGNDYTLFVNKEYKFNKVKENGRTYYEFTNGKGRFVSLGDNNSAEALWPYLNNQGEVVYIPGVLKPINTISNDSIRSNLQIKSLNEDSAAIFDLLLYPWSSSEQPKNSEIYRKSEIEGIPLIKVSSFAARDKNSISQMQEFMADAADLRGSKKLIIDLRGNTGGSDQYPYQWLQSFTGLEDLSRNSLAVNLRTDFSVSLMENLLALFPEGEQDQLRQMLSEHFRPSDTGWGEVHTAVPHFIPNETKIVVLIDSRVMSAGESLVRYLQQLENVIFIGSNTRGMGLIGNLGGFTLINSGLEVYGGISIFLDTDLENREGRGYMPDFWVENSRVRDIAVEILLNDL